MNALNPLRVECRDYCGDYVRFWREEGSRFVSVEVHNVTDDLLNTMLAVDEIERLREDLLKAAHGVGLLDRDMCGTLWVCTDTTRMATSDIKALLALGCSSVALHIADIAQIEEWLSWAQAHCQVT